MPAQTPPRTHRPQHVDTSLLSGEHEWAVAPQENISFRQIVEENPNPRTDASRYKLIAQVNNRKARNCFSRLFASKTLFLIPETIYCDRTFARDVNEVYYLHEMDEFLQGNGEPDVCKLPILNRDLSHRASSSFLRRPWYLTELYERLLYKIWLPFDAWESACFSYPELSSVYPRIREWVSLINQPFGLPIPCPFVVYYFHSELAECEMDDDPDMTVRMRRLLFCLKHEFFVLFIVVWWLECVHGCRQYVVNKITIDILDRHCGRIESLAGMPVQAIITYMRAAERRSERHHNWLCFVDRSLEISIFLWSVKRFGDFDHSRRSGMTLYCDINRHKIQGKGGGNNAENDCVLDRMLSGTYISKVSGLLPIVNGERWDANRPRIVGDLLHNLVHLYNRTLSCYNETHRMLQERQFAIEAHHLRLLYRSSYEHASRSQEQRDDEMNIDRARNRDNQIHRRYPDRYEEHDGSQNRQHRSTLQTPERRGIETSVRNVEAIMDPWGSRNHNHQHSTVIGREGNMTTTNSLPPATSIPSRSRTVAEAERDSPLLSRNQVRAPLPIANETERQEGRENGVNTRMTGTHQREADQVKLCPNACIRSEDRGDSRSTARNNSKGVFQRTFTRLLFVDNPQSKPISEPTRKRPKD